MSSAPGGGSRGGARTREDGSFSIDGVPAGEYSHIQQHGGGFFNFL
ncbi:MAG TPA: hypothetical protein VF456_26515 [Vicinamibacterales bacterium]